jgi:hypothetical protein
MAVLDTNVIIEIARGNKKVLDNVLSIDSYFHITPIMIFEIKIGAPKLIELNLIDSLDCLHFDKKSAETSANIYKELKRRGKEISLRDLFIGAICISNKQKLISLDSDFKVLEDFGLELSLLR